MLIELFEWSVFGLFALVNVFMFCVLLGIVVTTIE